MSKHGPEQPAVVWVESNFETGPSLGRKMDRVTSRPSFQLKIIMWFSDPKFLNKHLQGAKVLYSV